MPVRRSDKWLVIVFDFFLFNSRWWRSWNWGVKQEQNQCKCLISTWKFFNSMITSGIYWSYCFWMFFMINDCMNIQPLALIFMFCWLFHSCSSLLLWASQLIPLELAASCFKLVSCRNATRTFCQGSTVLLSCR